MTIHNWALIIGINTYNPELKSLDSAVSDAEAIKNILISDFGYNSDRTIWLPNATREQILHAIESRISLWEAQSDDQLLVFFAGHGKLRQSNDRWYLVPSDAKAKRIDKLGRPTWDWDSFIDVAVFWKISTLFKGKHICYIFDACRSGAAANPPSIDFLRSCSVIVAGTSKQRVIDTFPSEKHSVLTATLLDAFRGWGAVGRTKYPAFSTSELRRFIEEEVPRRIARSLLRQTQTPFGTDRPSRDGELLTFQPEKPRLPLRLLRFMSGSSIEERQRAAREFARLRDQKFYAFRNAGLKRLLAEDESISVRAAAIYQMGETGDSVFFDTVAKQVKSEHLTIAEAAIKTLPSVCKDKPGLEVLRRARRQTANVRLKRQIYLALMRLGDPGAIKYVLEHMFETAASSLRAAGMADIEPTPEVIDRLMNTLRGVDSRESWRAQRFAAELLGYFGIQESHSLLLTRATSLTEYWPIRVAAMEALGQIADQLNAETAQAIAHQSSIDTSMTVRTSAIECLGMLPEGLLDLEPHLSRGLTSDSAWRVRRAAAESFSLARFTSGLPLLVRALRDSNFRVRRAAVLAVGELCMSLENDNMRREYASELMSVSENDPSGYVRRAAEYALSKLK